MIDPHASLYEWVEKMVEKDAIAHLPKIPDILTGTAENVPVLSAAEQYTLVHAIAQEMKYAEERFDDSTWKSFCNHVGHFIKEHFAIEMQALLYHVMAKKLQIPFTKVQGTALSSLCTEIRDVLRKTV